MFYSRIPCFLWDTTHTKFVLIKYFFAGRSCTSGAGPKKRVATKCHIFMTLSWLVSFLSSMCLCDSLSQSPIWTYTLVYLIMYSFSPHLLIQVPKWKRKDYKQENSQELVPLSVSVFLYSGQDRTTDKSRTFWLLTKNELLIGNKKQSFWVWVMCHNCLPDFFFLSSSLISRITTQNTFVFRFLNFQSTLCCSEIFFFDPLASFDCVVYMF